MPSFPDLLREGAAHAWLFVPSAVALGALHGLEPGHSKTMMAAFIVAVRGSVGQAVLLGLSATLSHTAVVWLVALAGLQLGRAVDAEATEPYFQLGSAVLVIGIAAWMIWRTWRDRHPHADGHAGHDHDHDHDHDHNAAGDHALDVVSGETMDAHERHHADEIRRRFAGRRDVTTGQIVLFGLTGGLIPCPAAVTVLLLCLQVKEFSLGVVLVLCFSVGLAVTMVSAGVVAALSMRHASRRWPGFEALARRAPYASGVLMIGVGLYMGVHGWLGLAGA